MSRSDPFRPEDALVALEQLAPLSVVDQSVESVLQAVVDTAKEVLLCRPEASITLLGDGRPTTASSTGPLAVELDEAQYSRGYGPCLESAATGRTVEVADTASEARWADYCRLACAHRNGSSLSVPLLLQERVRGALNLYAREPHAFDDAARAAATRFAPYTAVAVANVEAYRSARRTADNLRVALESREVIDQAKGILIERYRLSADAAFQALAAVSMRSNTKVRDIAEQLVQTGTFDVGASGLG
jgi:GAF domain-containing protein